MGAALLMGTAIGVTWLGPAAQTSGARILVIKTDGTYACGELTSGKAKTVNVIAKKGADPTEIALSGVLSAHSVAKCP